MPVQSVRLHESVPEISHGSLPFHASSNLQDNGQSGRGDGGNMPHKVQNVRILVSSDAPSALAGCGLSLCCSLFFHLLTILEGRILELKPAF